MSLFIEMFLKLLSKPSNIVIMLLIVVITLLGFKQIHNYIKIHNLENKTVKLKLEADKCLAEKQQQQRDFEIERDICIANLEKMKKEIFEFNKVAEEWQNVIDVKNEQVKKEQVRAEEWKKKYLNKICLNNDNEVVKPSEGVIDDKANDKVISELNKVFGVQK